MSALHTTRSLALALVALAMAGRAQAQGRGSDHDRSRERTVIVQQGHPKRYKRVHSSDEAVDVTRGVLREQGYELVRVERRNDVRVIYYRRGNMGRGRGKGPIAYMIVRPTRERIYIERAPHPLVAQINILLGY